MKVSVNIKHRVIVNRRKYASVDELPVDVRQAYEKARASSVGASPAGSSTYITCNGRTYESVDAMPEAERELYRLAMKAAEIDEAEQGVPDANAANAAADGSPGGTAEPFRSRPVEPESSFSARWLGVALLLLGLLVALLYLRQG